MEHSPAARRASTKRIIYILWVLLVLANGFVFAIGLAAYAWISSKNVAAVAEDKALCDAVQINLNWSAAMAGISGLTIACLLIGAWLARKL